MAPTGPSGIKLYQLAFSKKYESSRQFNRFEMTRFDDDQVSQIRRGIVVAKDGLFVLKCGICDSSTVDALMAWDCRQGKGFTFSL
ncbi:hypothetical protein RHMOL_Rhmol08G0109500 [Rhododendron molle]|uniref:Uncharacterized protein n=1 Tax=Rhododendron molle TaxID=49168 RepID=A0ACC0MLX8_RHOML|nr:hypothetical protein RHMOL_Rhmol08G0109500 [Rhododendron molle]